MNKIFSVKKFNVSKDNDQFGIMLNDTSTMLNFPKRSLINFSNKAVASKCVKLMNEAYSLFEEFDHNSSKEKITKIII